MQLITKELENRFRAVGNQDGVSDPIVIAKFFNASGAGTWFATEYDNVTGLFFGYVSIFNTEHENELGYFSLAELQSVKGAFGLGVERDRYFTEMKLSEAKAKYKIL